jgi:dTDP-4-dehydrorhamnose reductase
MKILVTGYTGLLGYDVVQAGLEHGFDMVGIGSRDLNIVDGYSVSKFVKEINPEAIIHCAAYTAVDKAEDDKENCWDINVNGTINLVNSAKEIKAKFMYISTDYVFDGLGERAFSETDTPNPANFYGLTKLEGEKVVQSLLSEWFIVRISWIFGMNGKNFVKTMLQLADSRKEIHVVGDQVGSPTYTFELSRLLVDMIKTDKYGIYHATNEGFCSWAEFAEEIFRLTKKSVKVNTITTEKYPTRAVRPKNSRMLKNKLIEEGFKPLPNWRDSLVHFFNALNYEVK